MDRATAGCIDLHFHFHRLNDCHWLIDGDRITSFYEKSPEIAGDRRVKERPIRLRHKHQVRATKKSDEGFCGLWGITL